MSIDKSLMKDEKGRYLTQSLFLEFSNNPTLAVYTLDGEDKSCENNRAVRPLISLKKRFLEAEDIFEYDFACTWLYDWEHWQRLLSNKVIRRHIDVWRDELEIKVRSYGFQKLLDKAEEGDIQAIKYVSDKGWSKKVGRPSKSEKEREQKIFEREEMDFEADIIRLQGIDK